MRTNNLFKVTASDVQRYIAEHETANEKELVLKHKEILGIPSSVIAGQISARRKAKHKLPLWYQSQGIIYPPTVNLEQASSQATASYKSKIIASLIPAEQRVCGADLTGGFGVDCFFLSSAFQHYHYTEPNLELLEIVRHNHFTLNSKEIKYHHSTAENFLSSLKDTIDFVFIDPSRRDESSRKVFRFSDCVPNITLLEKEIFKTSSFILVKASPLLDIQQGLRELTHVKRVIVLSVDNDCKEVLFFLDKSYSGEPETEAVDLDMEGRIISSFCFVGSAEANAKVSYSEPKEFLYEPSASILKAGAFKSVAQQFGLEKLSANTHLYTASHLIHNFPGRTFRIEHIQVNEKVLPKIIPDKKVNITTRNYPLTPDEIKKKYKLLDGGEKFLIGFSSVSKKHLVVASRL